MLQGWPILVLLEHGAWQQYGFTAVPERILSRPETRSNKKNHGGKVG